MLISYTISYMISFPKHNRYDIIAYTFLELYVVYGMVDKI